MSTTNNQGGRFGLMCRKMFIEQRRTLLITVLVYLAFCAVPGLWSGYFGVIADTGGYAAYTFFASIACAFIASKAFHELTTKEGRTALLMTPSTTAEKFWPRVAVVTVGLMLLVYLGGEVLIYTNMLMIGLKFGFWMPEAYLPYADLFRDAYTVVSFCMLLAVFLLQQSLFIFGSVAWPRHSFLKSFALAIVLLVVWIFAMIGLSDLLTRAEIEPTETSLLTVYWSLVTVLTACMAGLLAGAYVKLKNKQVV